jgi:hypothetical protein
MRNDEIRVIIMDFNGKTFSKDWKNTSDKRNAIRWTLEHGDLPYYLDVAEIINIEVIGNTKIK